MLAALVRLPVMATYKAGRHWPLALGLWAGGTALLRLVLPALARRLHLYSRADLFQQAGTLYAGWAAADLLGQVAQHPLRVAYPPLPAAWFALLLGRAAISGGAAGATLLCPPLARPLRRVLPLAHLGLGVLTTAACYWGAARLHIRRVRVPVDAAHSPLRIVHLSDLHLERLTRRDEALIAGVRAARPDLLLLSGDYINIDWRDEQSLTALHHVLCALGAIPTRYGAFAVRGNVDRPLDTLAAFSDTGIRLLDNEVVRLDTDAGPLEVLGVTCQYGHVWERDVPGFEATVATAGTKAPGTLRILLYHMPDLAPEAAAAGVDLHLCGHTHGGQIRLPGLGALFTSSRFGRRFDRGLHPLPGGSGWIYTTTGVGLEGMGLPRARVACPPEIAVLTVEGAPSNA